MQCLLAADTSVAKTCVGVILSDILARSESPAANLFCVTESKHGCAELSTHRSGLHIPAAVNRYFDISVPRAATRELD